MLRATTLLLTALLATTASGTSFAQSLVDIDLIDRDTGQWLPEYRHRSQTWVPGVPGHRYSVRLTNTTGERVLVVLSVDGVNAITGETAHPGQAGYVLEAWQSTELAYKDVFDKLKPEHAHAIKLGNYEKLIYLAQTDDPALDAKALEQGAVDETLGVLLKYQEDIAKLKGEEAARLIVEARAG